VRCGQASDPEGPSLSHHVLVFSTSELQRVSYPPISVGLYNLSPVIDSVLSWRQACFSRIVQHANLDGDRKTNMVKHDFHDSASASRVTVTCARRLQDYNITASIGQMALLKQKDASKCGQKTRKRSDGDRFGSGDAA
jgi:hypothetical protein